ncbi:putative Ig domain-containing protein [Elstera cyanobacteriorum]|uniref:putative Ig domain-containing protein n=1 Tax=Elstera cyanobacteriorum TaxID=2022747 RepID=UPI00235252EB|nr:putative Ig domain-containing protein [Elstera cyanobacteriorum]MCK6442262.1 putative Ig domain-containing protein [Elstera cyanobacteriorum]
MLLATRGWLPVNTPPPAWVTVSPLPEGEWEAAYSAVLLATTEAPPVSYSLPSGSLPPGLALVGDTISGTPRPAPTAPVWGTAAGSLGSATQGGSFAASLTASGAASFAVRAGRLPWGVTLDVETGALAGTLAVTGGATDDPGPPPVWVTAGGSLGTVRETYNGINEPVALSLSATGAAVYTISGGVLPWGLTLDRDTGALAGVVRNIGGGTWEPDTVVTWSAPASTNLGTFARGASVGPITQTVDPVGSSFYVVGGVLPWGVLLSRNGGSISGTVSNENAPGTYNFTVACAANPGFAFGTRAYSITIT